MSQTEESTAWDLFGDGRAAKDTRERLLFAALNLFYESGIHAVGIDRIVADVGVTKTTFYKHFRSKDDLVIEAVKLRDDWELARFKEQVIKEGAYDPPKMLLAMFDVMDRWFNEPAYKGCLFLTTCAEFPSPKHPIHRAAAGHYFKAEEDVRAMATAAGVADPATFAQQWITLLEGAVTYRMVNADDSAIRLMRPVAEELLQRSIGAPSEPE